MNPSSTSYDILAYSSHAYLDSHPRQLATLARFYGMEPVPVSRCRVLELGCGAGGNLIPIAYQYPDSEFVGIDLSGSTIERGRSEVAALELSNIALRHANIMDVDAGYGKFDYIIAHGVYSWVPATVREKVLSIFHDNMTAQGVAFVSYNTSPYSHLRNIARHAMRFHVATIQEPQQRVDQARAWLKVLSEAADSNSAYGAVLREQYEHVAKVEDSTLLHDDLEEVASFPLHEVVAEAGRHGLQYLCDASLWRRWYQRLPEALQGFPGEVNSALYLAREQYLDFIDGRAFRQTLLCHRDVEPRYGVNPRHIKQFHLAGSLAPVETAIDPADGGVIEFKGHSGNTMQTDHNLTKAALIELSKCWPAAIAFSDLLDRARGRLSQEQAVDDHIEAMTAALFKMVCAGHLEFYAFPPPLSISISERPEASRVVRRQAQAGSLVTSLRHDVVRLDSEIQRRFVGLADGTRTIDRITDDLRAATADLRAGSNEEIVTRQDVERNVKMLARLALLVR